MDNVTLYHKIMTLFLILNLISIEFSSKDRGGFPLNRKTCSKIRFGDTSSAKKLYSTAAVPHAVNLRDREGTDGTAC